MRTYEDIYKDYLDWMYNTTSNPKYIYEQFMNNYEPNVAKSMLYKIILENCYEPENGMWFFVKFIIGDLKDLGYPKPLRYNTLLRKWDRLVRSSKHICVLSARGHGKSVFFSELLNLYDMFLFQFRRIILISSSSEQAEHILDELKKIIDNNEWLSTKKDNNRWATDTIGFNKGYIMAKGIGSEILGQHVDRIVIDDILRTDNKLTDKEIEDYIDMNLEPMILERRGQMIVVGTPKRETDIFNTIFNRIKLEPRTTWKLKRYPAILDYEKHTLQCPDRFTWDEIISKRLSMGALKFSREYQLEFFSRETSLFPQDLRNIARNKGQDMKLMYRADKRGSEWSFVAGVDVARSGAVSADFTVVIVVAYNNITQAKQIVHIWREKGYKIRDQAAEIAKIARAFNNAYILVEQNNMGQDMIDELVDVWNVNVEGFVTGGKGQKKDELIRFLITAFEYEQIYIPRGDEHSRDMTDALDDELSKFCVTATPTGMEKFEGVGGHDDMVIALALANKATQLGGVPFALTQFGDSDNNLFSVYGTEGSKYESDIVTKIKLGLIK